MENKIKRLKEERERIGKLYLLADKVDTYIRYARHSDLALEKEAKQADLSLDDRVFEEFARLGGQLLGLINAIAIIEGRYE